MDFVKALSTDNLTAIKAAPKTDVHCHAFLSTQRENAEHWLGHCLTKPPRNTYIGSHEKNCLNPKHIS